MKKKKILLFVKIPPPITGATLMNKRLNDNDAIKEMYHISSIAFSYSKNFKDFGNFGFYKLYKIIIIWFQLLSRLIFFRPNLVYFQISPLGIPFVRDSLFVFMLKLFRRKIVFHIRGKGIQESIGNNNLKKRYYNLVFRNTNVICLGHRLTYDFARIKHSRMFVVNNGIPDIGFNQKRKTSQSKVHILFLSNLIKTKGILDFVDALSILKKKNLEFVSTIVGAERDIKKDFLLKKIKSYQLENNVKYTGPLYDDAKHDILYQSDVLVFPTFYKNEAFPGVVLDGMQFQMPVISTYEAAVPEIIDHGENGFLVKQNDVESISSHLEYLIKNPDRITEMGINGRKKYLNQYTFEVYIKNLTKVFSEILQS